MGFTVFVLIFFAVCGLIGLMYGIYKYYGNSFRLFIIPIKENNVEKVIELLKKEQTDINHQNSIGRTPLLWAILNKNIDIVKLLIEHGADVTLSDKNGNTCLIESVKVSFYDAINLFLNTSVNINAKNKAGETALTYAVKNGDVKLVKLLINNCADVNCSTSKPKRTLLLGALTMDNEYEDISLLLIENGADVNEKDAFGNSPIIFASAYSKPLALKKLVEYGADVNGQDNLGCTALMHIVMKKELNDTDIEILNILLDAKADTKICNYKNETVFDIASRQKHGEILEKINNK